MCRRVEPLCTVGGNDNGAATVENWLFHKKLKNRFKKILSNNAASGYIPQIIESRVLNKYLHTHVHNSFIHNTKM